MMLFCIAQIWDFQGKYTYFHIGYTIWLCNCKFFFFRTEHLIFWEERKFFWRKIPSPISNEFAQICAQKICVWKPWFLYFFSLLLTLWIIWFSKNIHYLFYFKTRSVYDQYFASYFIILRMFPFLNFDKKKWVCMKI